MSSARITVLVGVMLAGCTGEPRSASYFEAHPAEAQRVAAGCKAGAWRGRECDTALAGLAAAADAARLEMYRKTF